MEFSKVTIGISELPIAAKRTRSKSRGKVRVEKGVREDFEGMTMIMPCYLFRNRGPCFPFRCLIRDVVLPLVFLSALVLAVVSTSIVGLQPLVFGMCVALVYQTTETIQDVVTYYAAYDNKLLESVHTKVFREMLL